jgi:hypothetical protein
VRAVQATRGKLQRAAHRRFVERTELHGVPLFLRPLPDDSPGNSSS